MKHWWQDAFFYHIYPLGFRGAEAENPAPGHGMGPGADASSGGASSGDAGGGDAGDAGNPGGAGNPGAVDRLARIGDALGDISATGCNAIYLGPVLESSRHGYDTADYYHTDRRLGDDAALARLVERIHEAGMHVILDGVFHHVGRDFWAFRKLREEGEQSAYRSWFRGVDFSGDNRFGDGFVYHGWEGNDDLVALDLTNPDVVDHLLGAVEWMMRELGVDGLRLDVAYLLNADFMRALRERTEAVAADLGGEEFWLMGEAIHGDYTELVAPDRLHSATNYECYKGLWSSHNDGNFFEIAHSLSRQFGPGGIYEGMLLYNFADNHDVDRVASVLEDPGHLYSLYALLMTMPGIPSVYYGSEYGQTGARRGGSDRDLRPRWEDIDKSDPGLRDHLAELQELRLAHPALRVGGYRQLHVDHTTLVFERTAPAGAGAGGGETAGAGGTAGDAGTPGPAAAPVIVAVNAAGEGTEVEVETAAGARKLSVPAYGYRVLEV